jgi:hypothetical protein
MFCIKCGYKNPEEALFCIKCGYKFKNRMKQTAIQSNFKEIKKKCPYCSSELDQKANYCPNCKKIHDANRKPDDYKNTRRTPIKGVLEGIFVPLLGTSYTGGTLILVGTLLCFICIGGIIGIPMILIGCIILFLGPILAVLGGLFGSLKYIKGPCPYCGAMVSADMAVPRKECPVCMKIFIIKNGEYFRLN